MSKKKRKRPNERLTKKEKLELIINSVIALATLITAIVKIFK